MIPPIFQPVAASDSVRALLGTNPVRFFSFGEADRDDSGNVIGGEPYAVWQLVYGNPDNFLSCTPDHDHYGTQIDAYGRTAGEARSVAAALRDALEPVAQIVNLNGEFRETDTRLYRYSFTVEWLTAR